MSYLGTEPKQDIVVNSHEYVATAGQTEFNVIYEKYVEVFLNGVQLSMTDFTATNGISVVLNSSVEAGDIVKVNGFSSYQYSNAMYLDTDQTVNGVKTFTSSPVVPDAVGANEPLSKGQLLTEIKEVDGSGSGLDADKLDGYTWNTVSNYDISTTNFVQSGRGSGGAALTINDGYGNAQLTFNHASGVPEQNGNAARITVNTDVTTGAYIAFQVKSGVTGGTAVSLPTIMAISETEVDILGNKVWHAGNDGSGSGLDADKLRGLPADFTSSIVTNGYQKLPSGLIIQWQSFINGGKVSGSQTFPIVFPNAVFNVSLSLQNAGGQGDYAVEVSGTPTTAGFDWYQANNGQTLTIYCIAIGY